MSSSFLSVLIQRQAGKYGDRVALRYRDYKTETWIPVSWNQFAATVKTVSNALIELGIGIQENIAVFSQNKPECLYVDFGAFGVRAVTVNNLQRRYFPYRQTGNLCNYIKCNTGLFHFFCILEAFFLTTLLKTFFKTFFNTLFKTFLTPFFQLGGHHTVPITEILQTFPILA